MEIGILFYCIFKCLYSIFLGITFNLFIAWTNKLKQYRTKYPVVGQEIKKFVHAFAKFFWRFSNTVMQFSKIKAKFLSDQSIAMQQHQFKYNFT